MSFKDTTVSLSLMRACANIKRAGMKKSRDVQFLEALEEDKLSKERHERYCEILKEAEEKWRTRYD